MHAWIVSVKLSDIMQMSCWHINASTASNVLSCKEGIECCKQRLLDVLLYFMFTEEHGMRSTS